MASKHLKAFQIKLTEYFSNTVPTASAPDGTWYDAELTRDTLSVTLLEDLSKLEPFGTDNPEPVFMVRDCLISAADDMGKSGEHLKLLLEKDGVAIPAVGWNMANRVRPGSRCDILCGVDAQKQKKETTPRLIVHELGSVSVPERTVST